MTTVALPIGRAFQVRAFSKVASSQAGARVEEQLRIALEHFFATRLSDIRGALLELVHYVPQGDSRTVDSISRTIPRATRLAELIPRFVPSPELALDPDGEISFDWFGPGDKIFSASVDAQGRVAYASRFSEEERVSGAFLLHDELPTSFLEALERIVARP